MTPESVRKAWLVLAVVQLGLTLNVMGEIQNAQFVVALESLFGGSFQKDTPDSVVALWGVLSLSLLLIATLGLIPGHARQVGGTWRSRFPLRLLDFDPDIGAGRWLVRLGLLLGVLAPLWALGHCWRVMHSEGALCEQQADGSWSEIARGWQALWPLPENWSIGRLLGDAYRLGGEAGCANGTTTFFPLIEPLIFLLLTLWVIKKLFDAGVALFRAPKP